MEITIDIEGVVASAVSEALKPEFLQEVISSNVQTSVKRAVDNAFGYHSPFTKMLNEKVAESMPTHIEDLGRYSDLVNKVVLDVVNKHQSEYIQNAIKEKLDGMLKPIPKQMKLSELLTMLINEIDGGSFDNTDSYCPTINVELSDGVSTGYWRLYFDPEEGKSNSQCKLRMHFTDKGECFNLAVDGEDFKNKFIIGSTYGIDALILNLYTAGTKVSYEDVDTDLYYYPSKQHD